MPQGSWLESFQKGFTRTRLRDTLTAYLFLAPFLLFFIVFVLRSIVYSGYMSLYDWKILAPVQKLTKEPLGNYVELFKDDVWWLALKNSAIFAGLTVVGITLLALGVAVILHRKPRGSALFRAVFYAPNVLSVGVVAIIWGWLLNTDFGTLNYVLQSIGLPKVNWTGDSNIVLVTLSFITIWWGFGFPMLILLAGLQNIPRDLYEAAELDGASLWQQFRSLTLPLLRRTTLFVLVIALTFAFQTVEQLQALNQGNPADRGNLMLYFIYQNIQERRNWGYINAMTVILVGILLIFTVTNLVVFERRDID